MNKEKYLPIGTVVILQKSERPLMIIGFNPITEKDDEKIEFDYTGCLFPEGVVSQDEAYLFNHDMIEDIIFVGCENEDSKEFFNFLKNNIKEDLTVQRIPKNKTDVFDKLRSGNK